jgi:hypothetical protein
MMDTTVSIAIAREDGGVSIMRIHRADGISPDAVAEEVEKWQSTSEVKATGSWIMAEGDMPSGRRFRDAWVHAGGGKCRIDLARARALHMSRIRAARDHALAALDIPFIRAVEASDAERRSVIAATKQRLRDLPETLDLAAAETADQLDAIWPDDLPRR